MNAPPNNRIERSALRAAAPPRMLSVMLLLCLALLAPAAAAQSREASAWVAHLANEYSSYTDLTYLNAGNVDLQLDVYVPRGLSAPNPVVVYYHGGGWGGGRGSRHRSLLSLMPYLEMGFTVVNVDYRGAEMALAPAAVEDCLCALKWVVRNAAQYKFDVGKIVLTGDSAGSHLALTSGMLTTASGLDRQCPGGSSASADTPAAGVTVGAIVNASGATDLNDLLEGPNARPFAIAWFGNQSDRAGIARRVSPVAYARPNAPPVLTIHGDADEVVPISHAIHLHEELTGHGVRNQLVIVPGGGHGSYSRVQNELNWTAIRAFLGSLNLLPSRAGLAATAP
jgi:acetyl esterase/lipase